MGLSVEAISGNRLILPMVKHQSSVMLQMFNLNPRLSSVFATQQRWLLAHAAVALCFRESPEDMPSMVVARFLQEVAFHEIASRNTADAFVKEMLRYGYAIAMEDPRDRRSRPVAVAKEGLMLLRGWAMAHLVTLDGLDGRNRLAAFHADETAFARLQTEIAHGLLTSAAIREPQDTFSLFTWLNNGGVIMDWLITSLGEVAPDGRSYLTSIMSITEIAERINLSRTHFARKLREAEVMGSLGWSGKRGESAMWLSSGFVAEMIGAQALKLSIIDAACERSFLY
ncbi:MULTISPECIES: hypothetical protein [Hyphomicrobiales]|uniref:hypothetical protein n=1 Tax=Hyphomicrobiales TaxID=356 RepID=UPI000373F335|nr:MULTISPECIES: hypothetical protein [Phyllobacteriaceae]MCX8572269.1 hypothetical protein [Aminobacter sp. MET-1]